ncbi:MAG TPA: tripartite tricarboxylate transporter substrate binding protein [Burkholderiales bacterium]
MTNLRAACDKLLLCLCLATVSSLAHAQASLRLIVPFTPGGPVDFVGRVLGDGLRASSAGPVIVENRPGANGAVAIVAMKQAPADGKTLLIVSSGMITFSPYYESQLPYDVNDLLPIANAVYSDVAFIVANKVAARDVRELVALAKSGAKPLSFASAGQGNITHAYLELFKDAARVDLLHVPYKGAAPAMTDIIGGHVDGMFIGLATALPNAQAGKLKLLAVVGKRSALTPEVPTITEQGFPGVEILPWFGVFAARGTPPNVASALADELRAVMQNEQIRGRFAAAAFTPWFLAGGDFSDMIRKESSTWQRLIEARNLKAKPQ